MSRYAEAHVSPQGPGDARPTALQVVEDEQMTDKLKGKTIVVTGVSSGLGVETVRALATTGASFILTARDVEKAKKALGDAFEPSRMKLVQMDQASLDSVRQAAQAILASADKISILVNNAGIMAIPDLQLTKDGHELQFGVNHLSHFLLFQLLKPALLAGSTPDFASRVVNVSSAAHRFAGLQASDNYSFQQGDYNKWVAYAQSKAANVYMANEIERRYGSRGLHALSVHPGGIRTGLMRHIPEEEAKAMVAQIGPEVLLGMKSPEQGAATQVWAAIGREWEGKGGKYLSDVSEAKPGPDDGDMSSPTTVSHTYDEKEEARLWRDSLKLVGLEDDE
ncbi:NAD(P)-binding protein [Trichoderma citrinoviride]|uniref:NAD(P)-binding protein n=1 Tax=Trichoderma citrinoviride TaxID=58853 RepID=A0A2T4BBE4_9HYPO|nr:NAD(P)-binding protein [Trichoderma citrinoviride]PTB66529.1 NAD(P)-binding protein [Trichoderma citrinoviride]